MSALCLSNSSLSSCSLAASLKAAILEVRTSSITGCMCKLSLPGDIGGDMDGAGDRVTSGDNRE